MINSNQEQPSPIPKRVCACGCGIEFQPRRTNQIYLNKKHADYAHNQRKKKQRIGRDVELEKQLRVNDKVLDKYYKLGQKLNLQFPVKLLKTEGFDENLTLRSNKEFFYSYNYAFKLVKQNENINIIIKGYE